MKRSIVCLPRILPRARWGEAARVATAENPANHPPVERLMRVVPGFAPTKAAIAVLTTKYWCGGGVKLTVGFLDGAPADLRKRIVEHMNAWSKTANVLFVESRTEPQVRIAREGGADGGYWSYLGTDILTIPPDQPTMNLQAFDMSVPESEFRRVVRHETGHTMGFPHEHMRRELVQKIDAKKAIAFFGATQGWPPDEVRRQVLTPIEESSLWGTEHADPRSIMCYEIPGTLTRNGQPIVGGTDIDEDDYAFAAKLYPKPKAQPPAPEAVTAARASRARRSRAAKKHR